MLTVTLKPDANAAYTAHFGNNDTTITTRNEQITINFKPINSLDTKIEKSQLMVAITNGSNLSKRSIEVKHKEVKRESEEGTDNISNHLEEEENVVDNIVKVEEGIKGLCYTVAMNIAEMGLDPKVIVRDDLTFKINNVTDRDNKPIDSIEVAFIEDNKQDSLNSEITVNKDSQPIRFSIMCKDKLISDLAYAGPRIIFNINLTVSYLDGASPKSEEIQRSFYLTSTGVSIGTKDGKKERSNLVKVGRIALGVILVATGAAAVVALCCDN